MMLNEDLVAFFLVYGTTPSKNHYRTTRLQFVCWTPGLAVRKKRFIINRLIHRSIVIINHLTIFIMMMTTIICIAIVSVMMMIVAIIVITLIFSE